MCHIHNEFFKDWFSAVFCELKGISFAAYQLLCICESYLTRATPIFIHLQEQLFRAVNCVKYVLIGSLTIIEGRDKANATSKLAYRQGIVQIKLNWSDLD
jgi:hypothetical protein